MQASEVEAMKTVLTRLAAGAAASVFTISGVAAEHNAKEVEIEAQRVINEKVIAHITGGGKIIELTLSYPVNFSDLDITSTGGARELEKRVQDAARAACAEIGSKYPSATPSDAVCAQKAAAKAMGDVRKLVAAAR
jgi:UrcA family protein